MQRIGTVCFLVFPALLGPLVLFSTFVYGGHWLGMSIPLISSAMAGVLGFLIATCGTYHKTEIRRRGMPVLVLYAAALILFLASAPR